MCEKRNKKRCNEHKENMLLEGKVIPTGAQEVSGALARAFDFARRWCRAGGRVGGGVVAVVVVVWLGAALRCLLGCAVLCCASVLGVAERLRAWLASVRSCSGIEKHCQIKINRRIQYL